MTKFLNERIEYLKAKAMIKIAILAIALPSSFVNIIFI
mgnify:CR=1 FL=1